MSTPPKPTAISSSGNWDLPLLLSVMGPICDPLLPMLMVQPCAGKHSVCEFMNRVPCHTWKTGLHSTSAFPPDLIVLLSPFPYCSLSLEGGVEASHLGLTALHLLSSF